MPPKAKKRARIPSTSDEDSSDQGPATRSRSTATVSAKRKPANPKKKTAGGVMKLKHEAMWKHFDTLLAEVSSHDLIQINAKIIEVINDFLAAMERNAPTTSAQQ